MHQPRQTAHTACCQKQPNTPHMQHSQLLLQLLLQLLQ